MLSDAWTKGKRPGDSEDGELAPIPNRFSRGEKIHLIASSAFQFYSHGIAIAPRSAHAMYVRYATPSPPSNRHPDQLANQLRRPLRRDHDPELRVHRQRLHNGRIHHVQIRHPDDRRIHVHAGPDPARARPVVDLALRVRRRRRDVRVDLRLGRRGGDVERREVRRGQRGEDGVDEGGDVLGVLRVAEVDALGAGDEVGVEDDFARGLEARGAVDVERDGVVVRVAVEAGGADGALHAGFRAVRVGNVVPEDADFGGEGVRAGAVGQVQGFVRGDGVVVAVGVGLDGGAGELDEGVRVVEKAGADGGVVDPG